MRFLIYQESQRAARAKNEDRVGYFYTRDALLMVAADGMGGHTQGEVAAEIAIDILSKRFHDEAKTKLANPRQFLRDTFFAAHHAIGDYTNSMRLPESPRTTCVACVVQDGMACWAHAGDSRLMLFRGGRMVKRTQDHSYIGNMLALGLIREDQVAGHPARNRISSCLGGTLIPQIDISENVELMPGDSIVMCSDGFWEPTPINKIEKALVRGSILKEMPTMVAEAVAAGGTRADNTSVVAMTWEPEGSGSERTISTADMGLDGFSSAMLSTLPETLSELPSISDDEIDQAIAEIRSAIRRKSG